MRLAGLASNRGRNLRHLDRTTPGGATVGVILTNDPDAPVLDAAAEAGIPTEVVARTPAESRRDHERRINAALGDYDYDLVCLDGYMRVLSDVFLDRQPTTLNVHPSLLPSFPGADAWEQTLTAGAEVSGCTVHVVVDATDETGAVIDDRVDAGPIVTQEPVPVYPDDGREALKQRILHDGEFVAYPRAVRLFATDQVTVDTAEESITLTPPKDARFPPRWFSSASRHKALRYGENPHQNAAVYADPACTEANVVQAPQLNDGAKAMGYNNYNDADAALNLIKEFDGPAAAVIKHTNPAGVAVAETIEQAYADALATDPKSAFGGIVALNRPCDEPTAKQVVDSFKEVIVAPGYSDGAMATLSSQDNLRVLEVGDTHTMTDTTTTPLVGGRLVQDRDQQRISPEDLEVVTDREPSPEQLETMCFAWQTIKHVKSNAVLFAKGTETVGIGAGQVSRVDAVNIAAMKADADAEGKTATGAVMASDAFFPFPDGIEGAAEVGIEAVVQPGGSVNDEAVIDAANEHDMVMAFTGRRAFRHD